MNVFQKCSDSSDAVPLYLPQQLYLKPIARINISIQLPQFKKLVGKSVSNREIIERLRDMIRPDSFEHIKVTKSTAELIRFEAELDNKKKVDRVLSKLDNKTIKLKDFKDLFKVKAAQAKLDFPTRHMWDSYFRDARDMDEMKPGERPDTIYLSYLPIKWFAAHHLLDEDDLKPSEKIFFRVFEKFGNIRNVDIPICDLYRSKMKAHIAGVKTHSFDDKTYFEGYVQFKDYIGFMKAMDAFRGMKLVRKEEAESFSADIVVDFDRSKHLCNASIKRREIVRDRLVTKLREKEEKEEKEKEEMLKREEAERLKQMNLKNEKERRRRLREEKRKAKVLEKLKISGADEINEKIAKEEKKLLKAQRKLEAIRLVEALFKRIEEKRENDFPSSSRSSRYLSSNELLELKNSSESDVKIQKQKLHEAIEGRVMLKSVLSHVRRDSSSSSDSSAEKTSNKNDNKQEPNIVPPSTNINWYGYSEPFYPYNVSPMYPVRGHPGFVPYFPHRGGGYMRGNPGPSRGYFPRRGRGNYRGHKRRGMDAYPPELQQEYVKYFSKFLQEHDDRNRRSYSRSRSPSRSRSRSYSHRRSRSRSRRSYSRSRSRSYRSRSPSRHRSKSRKSTSKRSQGSRRSRSPSRRKTPERKSRRKSRSRSTSYRSVDSSKFISPKQMRSQRSKSWSMPKEGEEKGRSWSRTPEKK